MKNKLIDKLLSIKSGTISLGADSDSEINELLNRGEEFIQSHITKKRGEPNQCHRNSAVFYKESMIKLKKSHWKIVCGYAFANGEWVCHSWLINQGSISETVKVKFEAYYGYVLDEKESEVFYEENY